MEGHFVDQRANRRTLLKMYLTDIYCVDDNWLELVWKGICGHGAELSGSTTGFF
jgi:hypothetical protein